MSDLVVHAAKILEFAEVAPISDSVLTYTFYLQLLYNNESVTVTTDPSGMYKAKLVINVSKQFVNESKNKPIHVGRAVGDELRCRLNVLNINDTFQIPENLINHLVGRVMFEARTHFQVFGMTNKSYIEDPSKYASHATGSIGLLAKNLPGMNYRTTCPAEVCDSHPDRATLYGLIQHVNDFHKWPREETADWLDRLMDSGEVDLSFKQ